jgi:hypothetical protein
MHTIPRETNNHGPDTHNYRPMYKLLTHDSCPASLFSIPKSMSRLFIGDLTEPRVRMPNEVLHQYAQLHVTQKYNSIREINVHLVTLPLPLRRLLL